MWRFLERKLTAHVLLSIIHSVAQNPPWTRLRLRHPGHRCDACDPRTPLQHFQGGLQVRQHSSRNPGLTSSVSHRRYFPVSLVVQKYKQFVFVENEWNAKVVFDWSPVNRQRAGGPRTRNALFKVQVNADKSFLCAYFISVRHMQARQVSALYRFDHAVLMHNLHFSWQSCLF